MSAWIRTFWRGSCRTIRSGPALHCMQSLINEHLHHRASPHLLWEQSRDRLGLYIVPEGLIGALWLQFARAVERDARFRQCAECTTWFEVAPGRGRTDKQFCSNACRTKAYRKRQAEAVRLHGEGRSLEDIARDLDSDPDTVRGWIERKLGRTAAERDRIARRGRGRWARTPIPEPTMSTAALPAPIALAPDLMTAEERLTEVAHLLAAGLLRLRRETVRVGEEWTGLLARPKRSCDRTAAEIGRAMSDTVLAQIAALKTKSTPELREMWQELFDREAPVLGRRYLEDRIAFRLQELHYGGLSDRARRKLDALADHLDPKAARRRDPDRLLPGTELRRQWQGVEHVVRVREHDFEYDGRPYRSLSAIAREIAGSRWNGWLFFGLRRNGTAR